MATQFFVTPFLALLCISWILGILSLLVTRKICKRTSFYPKAVIYSAVIAIFFTPSVFPFSEGHGPGLFLGPAWLPMVAFFRLGGVILSFDYGVAPIACVFVGAMVCYAIKHRNVRDQKTHKANLRAQNLFT